MRYRGRGGLVSRSDQYKPVEGDQSPFLRQEKPTNNNWGFGCWNPWNMCIHVGTLLISVPDPPVLGYNF